MNEVMSRVWNVGVLLAVTGTLLASAGGCSSASDSSANAPDVASDSSDALTTTYKRQVVYDFYKKRMRPGEEGAADDILDDGLTTQELVNALGWIATHKPPKTLEVSAINSNHGYSPAHTKGIAVDLYSVSDDEDLAMMQLLNRNPYVKEILLSGSYISYADEISGKYYGTESAPTHIHFSTRQVYGEWKD